MITGVTIGSKGPQLDQRALADMLNLGMTALRFQVPLSLIKQSLALYDDAVAKANAANLDITLIIKKFPESGRTTPQEAADMAAALASRYDGKSGHGTIHVLEIGNEDFGYGDFGALAACMNAVYPRVKAINPKVLVTPGSTLQRTTSGIKAALNTFWGAAAGHFDAINVHTYFGIPDNGSTDPRDGTHANIPSFVQYIQAVKEVNAAHGHPDFPIWDTEFGFPMTANFGRPARQVLSEQQMWDYLKHCYDEGLALGVQRMYMFTLGYASPAPDGMSLVQAGGRKTIAYNGLKAWIAAHGGTPPPPPPTRDQQIIALLNQALPHADAQGDVFLNQALTLLQSS